MARNDENTLDVLSNAGDNAIDLINRLDVATGKVQPGKRRGSIIKAAQNNVFEFPVFVSNSIPVDYAESIVALLEQNYAAYLQMAISMNPVVSASSVKNGLQFADYKTNTNKYLEYTELDFQHEACHNVIQEGGLQFEFDMLTIDDSEARVINEAVDYQPLSEFEHFFQETIDVSLTDTKLYPVPDTAQLTPDANGNHIEIDPDNLHYGTIPEIRAICRTNGWQNEDDIIDSLENSIDFWGLPDDLYTWTNTKNQRSEDSNAIDTLMDLAKITTPDEFKKFPDYKILADAVDDLDSRNKGFKDVFNATMDGVKDGRTAAFNTAQKVEKELERLQAELDTHGGLSYKDEILYKRLKAQYDVQKQMIDMNPNTRYSYSRYVQDQRRKAYYDATKASIDLGTHGGISYGENIGNQRKELASRLKKATMDTDYNGLGTITPEDLEAIQRQYSKEQLEKLIRDNKDLTYTDSKGKVHTISADDVARAQRVSIIARANIDEQNASPEMLDAAKRSALARANIDERNAYKATSPYYRRLDAIDTTASTVGHVASAADQTARAIGNIATLPSNIRHAKNQVELDKQNIAINKDKIDNLDKDRAIKKSEVGSKLKNDIQYVDDSKCQKLNTMKPLLMKTTVNILNKDDSLQPVNYVIGVKCHTRVIPASILPEVAKYPLKEMDKISRKVKWRAGELKFLKDLVFRIKEKKQTAADSRDPNRKWYRRLYELAHMKGDAPAAAVVQGKSIFATFIRDKQGKSKMMHGMIPNASIIVSKADVDNVKRMTEIDLLKGSTARNFCGELFLISFIVVDTDAGKMMHMMPDEGSTFNVMSMNSVEKQLATLNTAGTKTKEMFKLLG